MRLVPNGHVQLLLDLPEGRVDAHADRPLPPRAEVVPVPADVGRGGAGQPLDQLLVLAGVGLLRRGWRHLPGKRHGRQRLGGGDLRHHDGRVLGSLALLGPDGVGWVEDV